MSAAPPPTNYMTPAGHARMQEELYQLVHKERPEMVQVVSWAAGNGDRSENGDYIYGKKRLREIDRRIRFLSKRLESAQVVDNAGRSDAEQVFFGARVTYLTQETDEETTVCIVGIDETDAQKHYVSWISPVARALIKAQAGDVVTLPTPKGPQLLEILNVDYPALD